MQTTQRRLQDWSHAILSTREYLTTFHFPGRNMIVNGTPYGAIRAA